MLKKVVVSVMVGVSLFAAQSVQPDANVSKKVEAKKQKPQVRLFEVTSVDGKKFHFLVSQTGVECKECEGKVLIMDFFGKHCPPCRASIPILSDTQKKMGDKLQIVSFHVQETLTPSDLIELRKQLGINYPIVDMTASRDNYAFVEYIGAASGWQNSIPYMLFFDPLGRYRGHHYGIVNPQGLEKTIEKLYQSAQGVAHKKAKP